ncbi:MAG: ferrous iron transporter B, partial [Candidatus Margulisbacteria bacterium]|nr:ferrous iron transporter B [Candidatus Margulisiibacteriota bacterium]
PHWQRPQLKKIGRTALAQTMRFCRKAGPTIVVLSMALWVLGTYPSPDHSFASMAGQWMEPILAPMGVDWRVGVALLLAFAAREVFVSALVVAFTVGHEGRLLETLQGAVFQTTGDPIFTISTIVGLIVFFMIAMQCMSTLAVAKKEMGSWKGPMVMTGFYIGLAYLLSVATVQGLQLLGV